MVIRSENVGSVRFELTIDGSLRHASVLQRVIIKQSETLMSFSLSRLTKCQKGQFSRPIVHHLQAQERKDRWSPSPFRARPQPRAIRVQEYPAADSINSPYTNLRVWLSVFSCARVIPIIIIALKVSPSREKLRR